MESIIAKFNSALDENLTALKVCGVASNEFSINTLQNHKTDNNAHNDLDEMYKNYITTGIESSKEKIKEINTLLDRIQENLTSLEQKISNLEKI